MRSESFVETPKSLPEVVLINNLEVIDEYRDHDGRIQFRLPKLTREILKNILNQGERSAYFAQLIIYSYLFLTKRTDSEGMLHKLHHAFFVGSVVHILGISYGVVNDMRACRSNIEYFTYGHQPRQEGVLETADRNANAFAWGTLATFRLSLDAGLVTAAVTLYQNYKNYKTADNVLGLMGLGLVFPLLLGELGSYFYHCKRDLVSKHFSLFNPQNRYTNNLLRDTSEEGMLKKIAWLGNGCRNLIGYVTAVPYLLFSLYFMHKIRSTDSTVLSEFIPSPEFNIGFMLMESAFFAIGYRNMHAKDQENQNNGESRVGVSYQPN